MTRKYYSRVTCPKCGEKFPAESPFDVWLRSEPQLDSVREGFVCFDCDCLIHRYFTPSNTGYNRNVQALMFVEVKAKHAGLRDDQRDTLGLFKQCLDNERRTPTKDRATRYTNEIRRVVKLWSHKNRRQVTVRLFGAHLLRMEGLSPTTSHWMKWNDRLITVNVLVSLLRFDLNPYTLRAMDWRIHHRDNLSQMLPGMNEVPT